MGDNLTVEHLHCATFLVCTSSLNPHKNLIIQLLLWTNVQVHMLKSQATTWWPLEMKPLGGNDYDELMRVRPP